MGLAPEVLSGLTDMGYTEPTPIQAKAIPLAMKGRDLIASASTGTGKTAAFLLPILQQLVGTKQGIMRVLVLTPTRELAFQIDEQALALGYHQGLSSVAIVGGMKMNPQEDAIRSGVEIIVATPGRLKDHMKQKYMDMSTVQFLVLDEADRMFDMGFLPDVHHIVSRLPKDRQTLLFSATMPAKVRKLADSILRDPATVAVDPSKPAEGLLHLAFSVSNARKTALLAKVLSYDRMTSVIVFVKRKSEANSLARTVRRLTGREADSIHSGRTQQERMAALEDFRTGHCPILIATDVAARGIDVDKVSHVVHFDVPRSSEDYIHRSGRTGRAGETGEVITFVSPQEEREMASIEKAIGAKIQRDKMPRFDTGLNEQRSRR
ncbi:MAG: DEAD/DEAH box helicase [Rhodobacterales bacterium]|nr:DEAD/DEAH box helicase [Rhodobacterales bacterium]